MKTCFLLGALVATLAACSPTVTTASSPTTAADQPAPAIVSKIFQTGRRWMVHGTLPNGTSEAFYIVVKAPKSERLASGRTRYAQLGLTALSYTPGNETEEEILSATQLRPGNDGLPVGFSQCLASNPGSAQDITRLTGTYTVVNFATLNSNTELKKDTIGTCTLTLES